VRQLLEKVRDLFQPLAEEKGVELTLHVPTLAPAPLQLDERLIERSVYNLVQNAVKFTPKGGKVRIVLEVRAEDYLVSVEDTGPGIPADQLQAVFEKFRQLEGPQARSGFGLGLTIARQAIEAHGGRIWAESKGGSGARFLFILPLSRAVEGGAAAGRDPRD
jgi:two-component system phosphate regulon sensor histidine kinase PhoR